MMDASNIFGKIKSFGVSLMMVAGAVPLIGVAYVHAEEAPQFEKNKAKAIEMIDAHIALLQEKKSCVSAATGHESLKKCHEAVKAKEHDLREKGRALRDQRIDEKIKNLQEKKADARHEHE